MSLDWLKKLILVQLAILALGLHASAEVSCCSSYYHGAAGEGAVLCVDGEAEPLEATAAFLAWAEEQGVLDELAGDGMAPGKTDMTHGCDCHDNNAGKASLYVSVADFVILLVTLPERERAPDQDLVLFDAVRDDLQARAPPFHHI